MLTGAQRLQTMNGRAAGVGGATAYAGAHAQQKPAAQQRQRSSKPRLPSADQIPRVVEERVRLPNGDVHVRQYIRGKFLGKGGFAKCYAFKDLDENKVYAGKVIAKSSLEKTRARNKLKSEVRIHRSLDHRHVVKFVRFFEDSRNVYIILEMCNNRSMMELIKQRRRLSETEARFYMLQMVDGVRYMHATRVIHRDLKLGNLFLHNMEVKIGDFGLAARLQFDGERKKTVCGTPNYIAPEILAGKNGHSYEVDVWSMGVILYTMIIGKPPFETNDVKQVYRRIRHNFYAFPDHVRISKEAEDLIRRMLHAVPERRPTLDEVVAHPFFADYYTPSKLPESALAATPQNYRALHDRQKTVAAASSAASAYTPTKQSGRALGDRTNTPTQQHGSGKGNASEEQYYKSKAGRAFATKEMENMNRREALRLNSPKRAPAQRQAMAVSPRKVAGLKERSVDEFMEVQHMNELQQVLSGKFAGLVDGDAMQTDDGDGAAKLWVAKWVDYSNKYGLGYELANGIVGAFFNDATRMTYDPSTGDCQYISHRLHADDRRTETVATYHKDGKYSHGINKKITLIQYFRNYLIKHAEPMPPEHRQPGARHGDDGRAVLHVKRWMRTNRAIVFRLSNQAVQLNFFDHSKVVLTASGQSVLYIDTQRNTRTLDLVAVISEPSREPELASRLQYARQVLGQLISSRKNGQMNIVEPDVQIV